MSSTTTSHAPGVFVNAKGKKIFVPLENNPEVFTDLVHRLGVSDHLGFYDVYSIDEPELLSMVPRPVHALIFISPADVYHRVRKDDKKLNYDGSGEQEPILWVCNFSISHFDMNRSKTMDSSSRPMAIHAV